jgi:streptogramin lyase
MDIRDAKSGDVFVDKDGKLWRVTGVWLEPTVEAVEIEPKALSSMPGCRPLRGKTQFGGVSGAMWSGFKRIWRKDEA